MTAATASPRASPRSSWDHPASRSSRHPKTATTPASVGQAMPPPRGSSKAAPSPRTPNYFGLVVDPSADPLDSNDPRFAGNKWSPPGSSIRAVAAHSPVPVTRDPNSDFAAFRKESETATFTLGHGNLSHFSMSAGQRADHGGAARPGQPASSADDDQTSPLSVRPSLLHSQSHSSDRMDVDSAPSQRPPQQRSVSSFEIPRYDSPIALASAGSPQPAHPTDSRLSLPATAAPRPSPTASRDAPAGRAETLPASIDKDGPSMIAARDLVDLSSAHPDDVLLLDLRVYPQFARARLSGALNLCIPTTLLKRPSFNLRKLAETFTKDGEKARFARWRSSSFIVVYDDHSAYKKDAVSCVNTLKKFAAEGWRGQAYILKGGFADFSKAFPGKIDSEATSDSASPSSRKHLTLEPAASDAAPVAGGCPMPASRSAANPFFGNIRQNMDLIGGVGQMPIKRPAGLPRAFEAQLPQWVRTAIEERDAGKAVSDRFLAIERDEQSRMQAALSCHVSYGTPSAGGARSVQIAGIEKGGKNRYNNIWPYDHARVKLQGGAGGACDYVNASHIRTSRSNKRYIATQGPLPATFEDFWRVVWEQDVRVIVMLTAESEGGQLKCHPYWNGRAYGALKLQPLSERRVSLEGGRTARASLLQRRSTAPTSEGQPPRSPLPGSEQPHVILRKFTLSHAGQPFTPMREITQLQYSSWPDFGAPAHPAHVLGLVEQVDAVARATATPMPTAQTDAPDPASQRPVLVHCSAGCGRTGTFCTVDTVIDMLKRQRAARFNPGRAVAPAAADGGDIAADTRWLHEDEADLVAQTVEELRGQRLSMVQSLCQYVLCYETVLEWLVAQHLPGVADRDAARRSYG
ncbi:MAG: hypothetical protein M1832_004149 [Thelocarpon impressellum]|nr:MAG: hypothetical protein M1832_004149 [Thelocarpon impressellum]